VRGPDYTHELLSRTLRIYPAPRTPPVTFTRDIPEGELGTKLTPWVD